MNGRLAIAILLPLLIGPIVLAPLERNLEAFFFVLGITAALAARCLTWAIVLKAATEPILISLVVVGAALVFVRGRPGFDRIFGRIRGRLPRPVLTALAVFVIALASALITSIVAALVLVEITGLLRLERARQLNVIILGCFAIGLCSALTPMGGPLSTLAAGALGLNFFGLFRLLAGYVMPAVVILSLLAGMAARGGSDSFRESDELHENPRDALLQGLKVFGFISGLVLIGEAFAPLAARYVPLLGGRGLYWGNTISAALDNSTLVALEFHHLSLTQARLALLSLLISGGMLIPGNIPNIICAGILHISSYDWARVGVPLGVLLLGIYFAVLAFQN
jgi:predicted cation transporter